MDKFAKVVMTAIMALYVIATAIIMARGIL